MKVQVSRKDIISLFYKKCDLYQNIINLLTSPGEVVSVFTSPYLSEGAPALIYTNLEI